VNSVKQKPQAIRKKNKTIEHTISTSRGYAIRKKNNGTPRHKIQNASTKEFFSLKDISGFNNENLAILLGTTQRTIQNKRNSGEYFDIAQTERLRKLTRLFKEGNELFGNYEEFNKWLQKPSYGLDYDIPSELLKQPGGLDKIMNELNSIKFGDTI
jgi:putative toxin-antitoxin system antitoxin component (TIGR02293 family)